MDSKDKQQLEKESNEVQQALSKEVEDDEDDSYTDGSCSGKSSSDVSLNSDSSSDHAKKPDFSSYSSFEETPEEEGPQQRCDAEASGGQCENMCSNSKGEASGEPGTHRTCCQSPSGEELEDSSSDSSVDVWRSLVNEELEDSSSDEEQSCRGILVSGRFTEFSTSYNWQKGSYLKPIHRRHEDFIWIESKMAKNVVAHAGCKFNGYEILQVYKVLNSNLWEKYIERRSEIAKEIGGSPGTRVQEMWLFHASPHIDGIPKEGFNLDLSNPSAFFGRAICFAELSSKVIQYCLLKCSYSRDEENKNACDLHKLVYCHHCIRSMLVSRVTMGNEYHTDLPLGEDSAPPDGYHSVVGNPGEHLKFRQYAIYHNHQALAGYLVKFRIKGLKEEKKSSKS